MLVITKTCTYENVATLRQDCMNIFFDKVTILMGKERKDDFHRIMFDCPQKRETVEGDKKVTSEAIESVRENNKKGISCKGRYHLSKIQKDHTGHFPTKRKKESGLAFCQELKSVTAREKDDNNKENENNIVRETSKANKKKTQSESSSKRQAIAIRLKNKILPFVNYHRLIFTNRK